MAVTVTLKPIDSPLFSLLGFPDAIKQRFKPVIDGFQVFPAGVLVIFADTIVNPDGKANLNEPLFGVPCCVIVKLNVEVVPAQIV